MKKQCQKCGTCCTAPDISTLHKPPVTRCPYLTPDNRCSIYETRPDVCRNYTPWELCDTINSAPPEERVRVFLEAFGMEHYLDPVPPKPDNE